MNLTDSFETIRNGLLNLDPVSFCENNLYLDGAPLRLNGNGYKPFSDIYRYIGIKGLERNNSKPVVIVKGRQVGATTMASALELYFVASNLFGSAGRPPMRIMHCFPQLELVYAYTKTKLNPMITSAAVSKNNGKKVKSVIEEALDSAVGANDSLTYKQFKNGNFIAIESTGINGDRIRGRQLCLETELPTPNGFVKLKNLKEGDQLFDENGKACNITKMHPIQESPESYRVTFDDGVSIDACSEHQWSTYSRNERRKKRGSSIRNTKEIFDTLKSCGESNHSISNCLPVEYSEKELLIDPYLLGIWLGDGDRYGRIESAEPEVLQNFEHTLTASSQNHKSNFSPNGSKSASYRVLGLTTKLTSLGLVRNPNRHLKNNQLGLYRKQIPNLYLQSSYEQRIALLQGLMDSDGCCYKDGRCEFTQVESRKELFFQVKELVESLGIKTRYYHKESWRYKDRYQDKYSLMFVTDKPVFRLARKLERLHKIVKTKSSHRFIVSVEPIDSKPMRCITVNSPSHLYLVTRSYIPTHNTVDCMFFDEVQDMRKEALGNATKILSKSQYGLINNGIQVYFGTPKQSGTEYWRMWNDSSQQYYFLGCENCHEYFSLYTPGSNDWEKIWIDDDLPAKHPSHGFLVRCTHCQHTQDKRPAAERGKWMSLAEKKPNKEPKFIGFHINQLYMPTFRRWDIINQKPENHPVNTERTYQNEVLGEFFSGNSSPITAEELRTMCAEDDRKFTASIGINEPRKVYAGFDWGQKVDGGAGGGQSYSCAVILTAEGPHILSIEFATKLKHNDPQAKRDIVEQMFRQYSVKLAVGDIGYANDLTWVLQTEHGDRFLGSQAIGGSIKNHIKYSIDVFPKTIQFERDYYIAELYDMMKKGKIKFPFGDWEKIGWLVNHVCSMDIKVTQDRSGTLKQHYVKGSTPNDGMMALLNAYLAYKFDITNGFKIINPNNMAKDPNERRPVPAILGYMPRLGRSSS